MISNPITNGKDPIEADSLSAKDHRRIAEYIQAVAGIQLPDSKRSLIESRLRKRQRSTGSKTLHSYIEGVLSSDGNDIERLYFLDALTTNKTDFYREPAHFRFLQEHIVKVLAKQKQRGWARPLTIWSAGCSSGEEPYTLAMEMLEIQQRFGDFQFNLWATDISQSSLQTAVKATYEHSKITSVPMEHRRRYLLRSKNKVSNLIRFAPEVRSKIKFSEFNLLTGDYHFKQGFDVIFCRNVMIYFNMEDRSNIIRRLVNSLTEGGLFFIGHSESINNKIPELRQVIPAAYQKIG